MAKQPMSIKMRIIHRYLGFFLAGVMAIYAVSGVVLIFRKTDWLKRDVIVEKTIDANLPPNEAGEVLKVKNYQVARTEGSVVYFNGGQYDAATGQAIVTTKELPLILDKLTHLHKSTTNDPLYYLNIFFGCGLLFFVISAFWMYAPGSDILKKGLWFTAGGMVLVLLLLFV